MIKGSFYTKIKLVALKKINKIKKIARKKE